MRAARRTTPISTRTTFSSLILFPPSSLNVKPYFFSWLRDFFAAENDFSDALKGGGRGGKKYSVVVPFDDEERSKERTQVKLRA